MKQILLFCLLVSLCSAKCRQATRTLYVSRLAWKIEVPDGYKISDTLANSPNWDKAVDAESLGSSYPYNSLFSIEIDKSKLMAANQIPFDGKKDGDYPDFLRMNNAIMYNMLKNELMKIDSVSGEEMISGVRFAKFSIAVKIQNKIISRSILLNKQFGDHSLGIFLSYGESETGEKLMEILRRSRFDTSNKR